MSGFLFLLNQLFLFSELKIELIKIWLNWNVINEQSALAACCLECTLVLCLIADMFSSSNGTYTFITENIEYRPYVHENVWVIYFNHFTCFMLSFQHLCLTAWKHLFPKYCFKNRSIDCFKWILHFSICHTLFCLPNNEQNVNDYMIIKIK